MSPYIPQTDYIYPEAIDDHMIKVKKKYKDVFDEHYPYRDRSFAFRVKRFWFRIIFNFVALPIAFLRFGLKVEGKERLRSYKNILKGGFISISNHVLYWDYLVLHLVLFPLKAETPTWRVNMSSANRALYRYSGVIPIPKSNRAKLKFAEAMNDVIREKRWLHVYPEASMWFYYVPIRPFKKGAFMFAYKNKVPILPLAFSYRQPKGIYALFKNKEPLITIHVGELQYADYELDMPHAVEELRDRCRMIMMKMVGIESEEENNRIMQAYKYASNGETYWY